MSYPPSSYPQPQYPVPAPAGPAPLDQPQYDATIGQAASRFWRKYAVFSGRASRSEYWWWYLISFGVAIVLQILASLLLGGKLFTAAGDPTFDLSMFILPLVPALVWALVALVPQLALTVRRLHDTNRSGWWYLLLLPIYPGYALLFLGLRSVVGDQLRTSDVQVAPLVAGAVLALAGFVGAVVVLVFTILGPDPRGARFDRRSPARV